MSRLLLMSLVVFLPSCGGWPNVPQSAESGAGDAWPELLPIRQIGGPASNEDPDAIREDLAARTASLQARAAILRQPTEGAEAMEDLRERLAR